jgi:hypothetical protein
VCQTQLARVVCDAQVEVVEVKRSSAEAASSMVLPEVQAAMSVKGLGDKLADSSKLSVHAIMIAHCNTVQTLLQNG